MPRLQMMATYQATYPTHSPFPYDDSPYTGSASAALQRQHTSNEGLYTRTRPPLLLQLGRNYLCNLAALHSGVN
jgi:hypothetical protein